MLFFCERNNFVNVFRCGKLFFVGFVVFVGGLLGFCRSGLGCCGGGVLSNLGFEFILRFLGGDFRSFCLLGIGLWNLLLGGFLKFGLFLLGLKFLLWCLKLLGFCLC